MRSFLITLLMFLAGGLLGAAVMKPQYLLRLWTESGSGRTRSYGLVDRAGRPQQALPDEDTWGRVRIGSAAQAQDPSHGPGGSTADPLGGAEVPELPAELDAGPSGPLDPETDLAEPGPLGSGLPGIRSLPVVEPNAAAQQGSDAGAVTAHGVVAGESLSSIAFARYGRRDRALIEALARFNQLADPNTVDIGQVIWLPPLEALE